MPEVSVILPVFNGEKTLNETIESILNQTFSCFELIIINDGSTDNTLHIIHNFQDSRISVHSISNSGPSAARNKGVELAKGNYISFIDADDLWIENKLEKQFDLIKSNPEIDIVYCWTMFIDENCEKLPPLKPVDFEGDIYEKILINNFIGSGSNILATKTALQSIGGFNNNLTYSEDWDLFIRLSRKYKFGLVKEFLLLYRQNMNSLSSNIELLEVDSLKVIENAYIYAPENLVYLKNETLSNLNLYISYLYLTRQNHDYWKRKSISKSFNIFILQSNFSQKVNALVNIILIILLFPVPTKYCKIIVNKIMKIYGKMTIKIIRK